jgi:hypothetical protein
MRPVVLQMGVTLDGFVHGSKGYEDWGLPPEDEEVEPPRDCWRLRCFGLRHDYRATLAG